jgi:hypothetical protein
MQNDQLPLSHSKVCTMLAAPNAMPAVHSGPKQTPACSFISGPALPLSTLSSSHVAMCAWTYVGPRLPASCSGQQQQCPALIHSHRGRWQLLPSCQSLPMAPPEQAAFVRNARLRTASVPPCLVSAPTCFRLQQRSPPTEALESNREHLHHHPRHSNEATHTHARIRQGVRRIGGSILWAPAV